MSIMNKLENKFGRLRLPNLIYVFVGAFVLGYVLNYIAPVLLMYLCFSPADILRGQIWRIFTYIVMMPNSGNIFLAFITCFIFVSIARSLEQIIGRFRLNFFLILGWLLQIITGFLFYFIMPVMYIGYVTILNPYYVLAMLFVLFAMIFPDAHFLLMFIIPVRGKWMIFITLAMYLLDVIQAFALGINGRGWILVFMIIAAIAALLLFLYLCGYRRRTSRRQPIDLRSYRRNTQGTNSGQGTQQKAPRHKCAICGRTDISNPELDFRYCSKCAGNYEYCSEHLYTHIHRTADDPNQN